MFNSKPNLIKSIPKKNAKWKKPRERNVSRNIFPIDNLLKINVSELDRDMTLVVKATINRKNRTDHEDRTKQE